jgi:outer membrane lipoprotein-sorting protein
MKKLKKTLRLICFGLFLLLAVTGISIAGAAPILAKNEERFNDTETVIEMVDEKKEDEEKK